MNTDQIRQFKVQVQCPVCLEIFNDPKSLECGHSFCKQCLVSVAKGKPSVSCPSCRVVTTFKAGGIDAIPTNWSTQSLVELFKGIGVNNNNNNNNNNNPTNPPLQGELKCLEHPKMELEVFCENPECSKLICKDCILSKHKKHDFSLASEVADKKKAILRESISQASQLVSKLSSKQTELDESISQVKRDAISAREELSRYWDQVRAAIQLRESTLKAEIDTAEQNLSSQLKERKDQIDILHQQSLNILRDANKLTSILSDIQFLSSFSNTLPLLSSTISVKWDSSDTFVNLNNSSSSSSSSSSNNNNKIIMVNFPNTNGSDIMQAISQTGNIRSVSINSNTRLTSIQSIVPLLSRSPLSPRRDYTQTKLSYSFGDKGNLPGQFNSPFLITLHHNNDGRMSIFIAERDNNRVQQVDESGKVIKIFGKGNLKSTHGVAIFSRNNGDQVLVVTDSENNCVKLFSLTSGAFISHFSHPKYMKYPLGIAVIPDSQILVVVNHTSHCLTIHEINEKESAGDHRLIKVIGTPNESGNGDGKFNKPIGVAVNSKGHIFVSDLFNYRIQIFDNLENDCLFLRNLGSKGSGNGQLTCPYGVAVDAYDNIIVADHWNKRIQIFSEDGSFIDQIGKDIAGNEFCYPLGIAIDSKSGNIIASCIRTHKLYIFTTGVQI